MSPGKLRSYMAYDLSNMTQTGQETVQTVPQPDATQKTILLPGLVPV